MYLKRTRRRPAVMSPYATNLGQISIETGVSRNWKYATFGLVALLGVQFWWWNKKAPQVLRLGY